MVADFNRNLPSAPVETPELGISFTLTDAPGLGSLFSLDVTVPVTVRPWANATTESVHRMKKLSTSFSMNLKELVSQLLN